MKSLETKLGMDSIFIGERGQRWFGLDLSLIGMNSDPWID